MSHDLLLNLKNLACSYTSQKVVQNLDLYLNAGDIGRLSGPSGCSKTITLRAITGFEPMLVRQVELSGETISCPGFTLTPERRRIGMVFQDYTLFPHLNVADNAGFGIRKYLQRGCLVCELLELVKLDHLAMHHSHELSDGQQQRAALTRALTPEPLLLLLGEPFSNLSAELHHSPSQGVRRTLRAHGTSTILVTYDQEEASAVYGRIGVFREGHPGQWDTPYNLCHEPLTPFVASFVGQGYSIRGQLLSPGTVQTKPGVIRGNRAYNLSSGSVVDVLLYPDDLAYAPQDELKTRTVGKTFLGAATLYRLQLLTGIQLESIFPSHVGHQPGDDVGIRVVADHLMVFVTRDSVVARLIPVQARYLGAVRSTAPFPINRIGGARCLQPL